MEAVIFDMDGVIIDSHSVALGLLCETANKFGCDLTIEEIKTWGSLSSKQFWQRVKNQFNLPFEVSELINSYDSEKEISKYEEIGLISGVYDLLLDLKKYNIKTTLATSASRSR